jgi:ATP-binding cassette subfamily C protein
VSIARALYRSPEVLFFDEATSALDIETEQEITKMLKGLEHETIVLIAHRPTMLEICDEIVVMDGGSVERVMKYEDYLKYEHASQRRKL